MDYLNEEFYHSQKIVEQIIEKKKLFIITKDKLSKYTLWCDDKKVATRSNPLELEDRIL